MVALKAGALGLLKPRAGTDKGLALATDSAFALPDSGQSWQVFLIGYGCVHSPHLTLHRALPLSSVPPSARRRLVLAVCYAAPAIVAAQLGLLVICVTDSPGSAVEVARYCACFGMLFYVWSAALIESYVPLPLVAYSQYDVIPTSRLASWRSARTHQRLPSDILVARSSAAADLPRGWPSRHFFTA